MTIRTGNHYTIETFAKFMRRLDFDVQDRFEHAPNLDHEDALKSINQGRKDRGKPPLDSLSDASNRELKEYLDANGLPHDVNQTIQQILEADDREWVHLYDGMVHDIIELHPEDGTPESRALYDRIDALGRLSFDNRYNVIEDIVHWEAEQKMGAAEEWDPEPLITDLAERDSTELLHYWAETVGEWVLSREDFTAPCTFSRVEWLAAQLGKVIDGRETDYGFVVSVDVDRDLIRANQSRATA
ncbi:hypothetical protein SAMN05216388_102619 [Halorientalis persicus]|uniref:Uncharacterized protein n=1 Tax=Halorientalis persicus TaxID=1367881 RepID=A0A1H8U7U4_9EURY|nr:hypothetical protein [Halorientalis persicus]SEO99362.1 hypothetical protein SAMN05216388_102619 [Halorientalis persicus]